MCNYIKLQQTRDNNDPGNVITSANYIAVRTQNSRKCLRSFMTL